MGLVFIECMACGTPVIGADSGGPRDFVSKSVGELVPESTSKDKLYDEVHVAILLNLVKFDIRHFGSLLRRSLCKGLQRL